ncbi:hypothetical protein [Gloeothece verrucosa]|uniref:Uncharacterized protein n=1 Tax=Gloeothece verrucosa (strain PCC 7822) TaxID=497965 RepID=E0U5Y6_GLOV7|nr:hypothetical protein [Gloeothece verrucosa]ADN17095.1 hypothetical protein Cyan7822_5213 [Gloeothece verrucosa PCC 7822]
MVSLSKKLSLDEYLIFDDGTERRYELEDGFLLEMPLATFC